MCPEARSLRGWSPRGELGSLSQRVLEASSALGEV